jgi:hypothetical protein
MEWCRFLPSPACGRGHQKNESPVRGFRYIRKMVLMLYDVVLLGFATLIANLPHPSNQKL